MCEGGETNLVVTPGQRMMSDKANDIQRLTPSERGRFMHKIFVLIKFITTAVYGSRRVVRDSIVWKSQACGLGIHSETWNRLQ
jgi:hypothetical protein